ncbi:helix-turn-helix transcriptional regulator [Leifsonia sp. AG29]|uniref:helix-turn-helix transcriptional regulator n=1 Tax=Leifsonia sp. AG29 TaxID=2598860 RepID=UPI00131D0EAA|nr:helix-turn-helix transcriptional regulator [Leifsonia sp. AG29]
MDQQPDDRGEIRDFLVTRRARITPEQAGLPTSARRRVPGLRREEVAVLAGVSTEWYTRLEKGHIGGVSDEVLEAVSHALRLSEDERGYLFELAMSARRGNRKPARGPDRDVAAPVQWMLDSITMSAAFVRNGRTDILAANAMARALFGPLYASDTVDTRGHPNIARFVFLDPDSRRFYSDWRAAGAATAAMLRAEAACQPDDRKLRELIGELSTRSAQFRTSWAAHDVLLRHDGLKQLDHPDVGTLELSFQSLALPRPGTGVHELVLYTAAPGTTSEDRLRILAIAAASESAGSARAAASDAPARASRSVAPSP